MLSVGEKLMFILEILYRMMFYFLMYENFKGFLCLRNDYLY